MTIDFHEFHLIELPRRMRADAGLKAARLARELPSLCVRIRDSDNAYTYVPQPHSIAIVAGTEAEQPVLLDKDEWQQLHNDPQSLAAVMTSVHCEAVNDEEKAAFLQRWQAVIAIMYYAV